VHRHLRRLHRIWIVDPIYFITTCTFHRRPILASAAIAAIFTDEWRAARIRHGWAIGRYLIMPDHVHFFAAPELDAKPLGEFMQFWKQWTSKRIARELRITRTIWQAEFFDHILRSSESYSQKWDYVRDNPARAGFVGDADEWLFQGEIENLRL
jgi:REP-associated tyrosine transposase